MKMRGFLIIAAGMVLGCSLVAIGIVIVGEIMTYGHL
jgi:hypothetical protein